MRAVIIELSLLAAVIAFVVFAAGIEGDAPLPACVVGMLICLFWLHIVAFANR